MSEQRQPFRFRLPWLATSQPQSAPAPDAPPPRARAQTPPQPAPIPAAPRPRTPVPASTPAPAQRPPFRPAGVAQKARAEPPPLPSRTTPQTRAAPPSPTRSAPQIPDTIPWAPARQASPQPQEPPKATPPPSAKPTSPPSQPTLKSSFPPMREPSTTNTSRQPKGLMKSETLPPPPQEPQRKEVTIPPPPPEKVMEPLAQEKKIPEASRELAKKASSPKPDAKQQPVRVEESRELPKGIQSDESKQKAAVPGEIVIEKKEIQGHGKVTRAAHRPTRGDDSPKPVQKHQHPYSLITLTGDNTGAIMHLSSSDSSSKREKPIHIHRGYKSNPYETNAEAATDGDEGSFRGGKSQDQTQVAEEEQDATETIYVNNNVQGINNSLVFHSSLHQRNPGVHLVLSRLKPVEPVVSSGIEKQATEARKAEVATTPTQRLAHAPTIKRRCLRGLFLESSDSEQDKPEKPRRHGCRVGCNQKSKDGNIDAL